MAFKFREPLVIEQSTGVTVNPNNTEIFGIVSPSLTTTISIGQIVATTSNIIFSQITGSADGFIIDNEDLFLKDGEISGSLTVSSNTAITQNLIGNGSQIEQLKMLCFLLMVSFILKNIFYYLLKSYHLHQL